MAKQPNFKDDQYFYMDKNEHNETLKEIKKLIQKDADNEKPFEKIWIPENQVTGKVKKIGESTFKKIEKLFKENLLKEIEKKTSLSNLELVGVRMNLLNEGEMISLHSDVLGYVITIEIPGDGNEFEGGNVIFRRDDKKVIELGIEKNQLLVAKCTNEHGVTRITKGQRESIALFTKPKD